LNGGDGNDQVGDFTGTGRSGGKDTITGGNGNDRLIAGAGADDVSGDTGNDYIDGGAGADSATTANVMDLRGGLGNDTVIGGLDTQADADEVGGGPGNDRLFGGGGADEIGDDDDDGTCQGGEEAGSDIIDAGPGDDSVVCGGDGNDTIQGGGGKDTLSGGSGNDVLIGGPGEDDAQTGGAGNDIYILNAGDVPNGTDEAFTCSQLGDVDRVILRGGLTGPAGVLTGSTTITDPITGGTYTITPGGGTCILQVQP
jgi:Ca2+-binding RTX toxin-like protein